MEECEHKNVIKQGFHHTTGNQRVKCKDCGKKFQENYVSDNDPVLSLTSRFQPGKNFPRILLLDIETLRMSVKVWGLYKQRIDPNNVQQEWSIACWAAKWLCTDELLGQIVKPREAKNRIDKSIIKGLWKLIDKADIVVAHNAKRFDLRKLNWRFLLEGLKPPSPYWVVDTLMESRKLFAASSHKLDYLNKCCGLQRKISTTMELWERCEDGDKEALNDMFKYCKGDIQALEDWYLKIRPWIKSHPNIGAFIETDDSVCPNCGSKKLVSSTTDYITPAGRFHGLRCKDCGGIGREMSNNFKKESRKKLIRSIAK